MADIAQSYADVQNIQPKSREDINRPSPQATRAASDQLRSYREQASAEAKEYLAYREWHASKQHKNITRKASYKPSELTETKEGYVYREYDIRRSGYGSRRREYEPYVKREVLLDKQGRTREVREYDLRSTKDGERQVPYLRYQDSFSEGRLVSSKKKTEVDRDTELARAARAAEEAEKRSPTAWEVTDAQSKVWRSTSPDFLEKKTGVDVRKTTPGTVVLREEGTNKVYYAREETIRGKKQLVGVGKPNKNPLTPVSVKQDTSNQPGKTPVEEFHDARMTGILQGKKGEKQEDKIVGVLKEAPPLKKWWQASSSELSERALQSQVRGGNKAGVYELAAVAVGVKEGAVGLYQMVRHPVQTAKAMADPATWQALGPEIQKNPFGIGGQVLFMVGTGRIIGKVVGKIQEVKGAGAAKTALSEAETIGKIRIVEEAGGEVAKTTKAKVQVGKKNYDVTATTKEQFAIDTGKEGVTRGGIEAETTGVFKFATGEQPTTRGSGRYDFQVKAKDKVVARGTGETGLAGGEFGDIDLYARTAKGTIDYGKRQKPFSAVETGELQKSIITERSGLVEGATPYETKGVTVREGVTEGKSTIVSTKGASSKDIIIKSKDVLYKEQATEQLIDSKGRYITVKDRTVQKGQFSTFEQSKPYAEPTSTVTNPLEKSPEFAFRQLFGEELPTTKRGLYERITAKKGTTPTRQELFESPKTPSYVPIENTIFPRQARATPTPQPSPESGLVAMQKGTPPKPTVGVKSVQAEKAGVVEAIAQLEKTAAPTVKAVPVVQPSQQAKQVVGTKVYLSAKEGSSTKKAIEIRSKSREDSVTKSQYKIVPVEKIAYESRLATALEITAATKQSQAQKASQAQELSQPTRTAPETTPKGGGGFTPPIPPPPPHTPFAPLVGGAAKKPRKSQQLFSALVRRRGQFRRVGTPTTLAEAFKKGRGVVEKTAAASFKIEQVGGGGVDITQAATRFLPRSIYTRSKGDRSVFVQRRGKRIKSVGEKTEITKKGLFTLKKKKGLFKF